MRLRRTFPTVALAVTVLVTPAVAADVSMTLSQAIERALAKNQGLVVGREALVSAGEGITAAKGVYDPLLEVDGGYSRTAPPVNSAFSGAPEGSLAPTDESFDASASVRQLLGTGGELTFRASATRTTTDGAFTFLSPSYDTAVGVELRQPLLRGRAIDGARLELRVADAEHRRAAASLRAEVSETVAAVERAYWNLVSAREEVGVREEAVRLADEQLEETRIRIQNGASPETEEAQPRAELERRRGELLAAREAVSRLENSLKLLILGDDDPDLWSRSIVPTENPEVSPIDVDVSAEIDRALAARPELAAADAVLERRAQETRYARNQVRPALDAVASYDRYGLSGSLNPNATSIPGLEVTVPPKLEGGFGQSLSVLGDGDFDDARVGVVLSVPLRNRAARAAARSAESAERSAGAQKAAARNRVRAEVLDSAAAVRTAYQRFEAARAESESARVQLDAERDRFAVGLSTNFLVLTRQNDLSRARLDEISARTDYRIARAELARSTGSLLEDRAIEVEGAAPASAAR